MKTCTKCNKHKPLDQFYRNKNFSDGYTYQCKECHKKEKALRNSLNKEAIAAYAKDYYNRNKEVIRERQRDYYKSYKHTLSDEELERRKAYRRSWSKLNRDKKAFYTSNRKAQTLLATPRWLSEEQKSKIEDFYWLARDLKLITGESYHVDHIVPLKGRNVCGLHAPWNLRVIPSDLNLKKSATFDG